MYCYPCQHVDVLSQLKKISLSVSEEHGQLINGQRELHTMSFCPLLQNHEEKKEIVQGRERRDIRIRIIYMWITKPEELQWSESGTFLYLWVMYVFVMWMLQAVSSHIHNYHRSSCWVLEANRIALSHAALALSLPLYYCSGW